MKKLTSVIISLLCILSSCKSTLDTQEEIIEIQQETILNDVKNYYEELNNDLLNLNSIQLFNYITEDEIYEYAEQVKGMYVMSFDSVNIFPAELIEILGKALYNSTNYSSSNFAEEIYMSNYYEILRSMGADDYQITIEELCQLFPELNKYKEEISNIYEAHQYIEKYRNCIDIFGISDVVSGEDYYIVVTESGGSDGANIIYIVKKSNNDLITVSEFKTQNNGYGSIIRYNDSFYYVFLEYNYNLKIYDGIRIHKIGAQADVENISIKYLPQSYIWKNIYNSQSSYDIDEYIDTLKDTILISQYLESGKSKGINEMVGDEIAADEFPLIEAYDIYHKIDFANIGIPIYIRKATYTPSNYGTTWHFRAKFYIYESESNTVKELDKLELGKNVHTTKELVQMWFKEFDDKIYTFTIHHISDYNYMLNVILIQNNEIKVVRTDIISPKREFILIEGEVFRTGI